MQPARAFLITREDGAFILNQFETSGALAARLRAEAPAAQPQNPRAAVRSASRPLVRAAVALAVLASLAACGGKKDQASGQALVSVNGEEITALQLNDEMQRAGVPAAQQTAARGKLLESLIERQLLLNEAAKEKVDRDPKVLQAIERAKALLVAQAYMQKKVGAQARPTASEAQAYFDQHPEFFSQRKQLDMRQLIVAGKDLSDEAKKAIDSVKTLDEAAAWFDGHGVKYLRSQVSRTTSDLPSELGTKLLAMPKGQLFIVREGERSVLSTVVDIKDAPVDFATASPQIEQYLINTKTKTAAQAEVARLRAAAKIEYLNTVDSSIASTGVNTFTYPPRAGPICRIIPK